MAKARAIIKRLKAVRNVRKITRTMELVATARFKKAMDRATQAAAYTRKISEIVADLSNSMQEGANSFQHPLLQQREWLRGALAPDDDLAVDYRAVRNVYVAVDNGVADMAVPPDIDVREDH